MREVQTIAPAFTMGLWGLSVGHKRCKEMKEPIMIVYGNVQHLHDKLLHHFVSVIESFYSAAWDI